MAPAASARRVRVKGAAITDIFGLLGSRVTADIQQPESGRQSHGPKAYLKVVDAAGNASTLTPCCRGRRR